MAKTGPLGKLEKYYIDGHHESVSIDDLATELDRSKSSITKYVNKITSKAEEVNEQEFDVGQPIPTQNNPVIMTEGMSQIGDLLHQQGQSITDRMSDCIAPTKQRT